MEDGRIADSQITASSERGSNHAAKYARLNLILPSGVSGGWSSRENSFNEWIQVDLPTEVHVTGVITQGKQTNWVAQYKVHFRTNMMWIGFLYWQIISWK